MSCTGAVFVIAPKSVEWLGLVTSYNAVLVTVRKLQSCVGHSSKVTQCCVGHSSKVTMLCWSQFKSCNAVLVTAQESQCCVGHSSKVLMLRWSQFNSCNAVLVTAQKF